MSTLHYSGPTPLSSFIHSWQHYTTNFKPLSVPSTPTSPFTNAFINDYSSAIQASAVVTIFILILIFFCQYIINCCCKCSCCYGDPVTRYTPPNDNDNDLSIALRHKHPMDEINFYHEHVHDDDTFAADDEDDPLREALGINNMERLMRRRRRRLVIVSVIIVLFTFSLIAGIIIACMYYNNSITPNANILVNSLYDAANIISNARTNASVTFRGYAVAGGAICNNLTSVDWHGAGEPIGHLTVIGGAFTYAQYEMEAYGNSFNNTDLFAVAGKAAAFENGRQYIGWFALVFVFVISFLLVLAVVQCRNKCCIELEERTNILGCGRCQVDWQCVSVSVIKGVIFIILTLVALGTAVFIASSYGFSDFCMAPSNWTQSYLSAGMSSYSATSQVVGVYSDCTDAINPLTQSLKSTSSYILANYPQFDQLKEYCNSHTGYEYLVPQVDAMKNQADILMESLNKQRNSLSCGALNKDFNDAFENLCHPFLKGLTLISFGLFVSLSLLILIRPCLNIVRYYRGHELMASLHAELKVNKPLMTGTGNF